MLFFLSWNFFGTFAVERFEQLYGVIQKEVGDEYAPAVMDAVLDKKFAIN